MKQKRQLAILAGLLIVSAGTWYWGSGAGAIAPKLTAVQKLTYTPLGVENPGLHREKLEASRRTEYKSSGRDLFSESAPPPPVAPKVDPSPQPVQPAPAPPPPLPTLPANMKFFGYGTVPNGTSKRAFLTDGEQVFIVSEGDTLLGRYRIVRIGNAHLDFEEISTGLRNSVTLQEMPS
jgi:hypothetical protein